MQRLKLNNEGSALITVLVVTTFITILATTMLYVSAMNFQQKQTDYENKQSFYEAEKTLDELKSILVKDVQTAYVEAYNQTQKNFLKLGTADARKTYFQEQFMSAMSKTWDNRVSSSGSLLKAVQSVMTGEYVTEAPNFYKIYDYGVYQTSVSGATMQKFALRGVQVKYTVGNYTTFLYTDICLEPPNIDWSADSFSPTVGTATDREKIAFTDYVSYVNWRKADYEYSVNNEYDSIDIGTNLTPHIP